MAFKPGLLIGVSASKRKPVSSSGDLSVNSFNKYVIARQLSSVNINTFNKYIIARST